MDRSIAHHGHVFGTALALTLSVAAGVVFPSGAGHAKTTLPSSDWKRHTYLQWREQLIHVLGTTHDQNNQVIGTVAEVAVGLVQRLDRNGIEIMFDSFAGTFSDQTQGAIAVAIDRTAKLAHLDSGSWSVYLKIGSPGVTLYGESLSAMVGLTVVALAKGHLVSFDRSLTGTVTEDGHIGVVSGVPQKIDAAHKERLSRVLVPDETATTDSDWRTPFLMQVSPVGTVSDAYSALTDQPW